METVENQILEFLKGRPKEFFTIKELGRWIKSPLLHSKGPLWAAPYIKTLQKKGFIEVNPINHCRFLADKSQKKTFYSPQVAAILKASGKSFSQTFHLDETEETLESFTKTLSPNPKTEQNNPDSETG